MTIDSNPSFGGDSKFQSDARRAANILWESTNGNLSSIPYEYLEHLSHRYLDGDVSLLTELGKVTFSEEPSYEEFSEVVEKLIKVKEEEWPSTSSILEVQADKLLDSPEVFEDFTETFDFSAKGSMSDKVELFLKKVISSVYRDGVTSVTDKNGNPPNAQNKYLASADGSGFEGIFYDKADPANEKEFPFVIREKKDGNYEIQY